MPLYTPGNLVFREVGTHCLLAVRLPQGIPGWVFDNIETSTMPYENTWPDELTALFRSVRMINHMVYITPQSLSYVLPLASDVYGIPEYISLQRAPVHL